MTLNSTNTSYVTQACAYAGNTLGSAYNSTTTCLGNAIASLPSASALATSAFDTAKLGTGLLTGYTAGFTATTAVKKLVNKDYEAAAKAGAYAAAHGVAAYLLTDETTALTLLATGVIVNLAREYNRGTLGSFFATPVVAG